MYSYFYSENPSLQLNDVHELFQYYNQQFFSNVLQKCTVQWSQRMTLCAGSCKYQGWSSCCIKMSTNLLKYRNSNEVKQTLLHQMIHAYLFITNHKACLIQEGHGPEFQCIMHHINQITGLTITIFHNFHDEVNQCRTHIWKCNGPCQQRAPFYGQVRRAINRKPQPADWWFSTHQRECGGQFLKISAPEKKQKKKPIVKRRYNKKSKSIIKRQWGSGKTIDQYFKQMQQQKNKGNIKYNES